MLQNPMFQKTVAKHQKSKIFKRIDKRKRFCRNSFASTPCQLVFNIIGSGKTLNKNVE